MVVSASVFDSFIAGSFNLLKPGIGPGAFYLYRFLMKRATLKLIVFFGSITICFLILEIIFRLPILVDITGGNQPEFKNWHKRVLANEINSLGFRDREHEGQKAKHTKRILIVGDSITYGQMVDYDKIFPVVLEKILNQENEDEIEVISMGQMGWNTVEQLEALKTNGFNFQPDLVIVAFTYNDPQIKDNPAGEEIQDPERSILPWRTVDQWLDQRSKFYSFVSYRYNRFLEKIGKKRDYTAWQRSLYRPESRGYKIFAQTLGEIKQLSEAEGAKVMLTVLNFYPNWDEETKFVLETSKDLGIPVLDLSPLFTDFTLKELQVSPSDGHPNAATHRLYAQAIADFILENIW